ncbi:hypothetical protein BVC80_8579g10 [Macleaya cordata]|uniref:DUF2470 domain-containing protein n=1 Tax=Macleaya cordata TaxID=56857 RepID=A0A200QLQ7_MACCD|nr:hypothetical protein BVC80_8579g10 [Macleaya cordata]
MVFSATSHSHCCQMEVIYSSISSGSILGWPSRSSLDGRSASDSTSISFRCRNPLFGTEHYHWLPSGQDVCLSKVWVAADYSDSVPDSSNFMGNRGYHPLEDVKVNERSRETMLTSAEIARTTAEANSSALLVFPGTVHYEPHEHISWAEFQYIIDDNGDIFFEIFDDENILQDRGAINPVNVLIGMDFPTAVNRAVADNHNNMPDRGSIDDITLYDDHFEALGLEESNTPEDWGTSNGSHLVHPLYFAKCLTKAINTKNRRTMDHPSNGLSIMGFLRPAYLDEESYLRGVLHSESDDYSDWKEEPEREEEGQTAASYSLIDGEILSFNSKYEGSNIRSTLYKLEIMRIELFSVYGAQCLISLQDFQEAEPDVLVHCASLIVEHFSEKGLICNVALKALCRKKGLNVEGAHLIGVDSLGMDVRVFSGIEAQTLRFPFKVRAKSESAAEKKIQRMLFPRYHRRNIKRHSDGLCDPDSF